MKECLECQTDISGTHYRTVRCKPCQKKRNREGANERRRNSYTSYYKLYDRNRYILKRFGLSPEEYQLLLEKQDGRCAICDRTPEEVDDGRMLAVDHDHETGEIRGLLCRPCNTGIGQLGDNPARIKRALDYLEKN